MKVRTCWPVLENRAEQLLTQLQTDTGQALRLRDSLLSSQHRLNQMLDEYRAQSLELSSSTGMSATLNQRQFMTRILLLRKRVVQDIAKSNSHLAELEQRTRLAHEARLKMQVLAENDRKGVQKYLQLREQASMDAIGVMQFNRASAT